MWEIHSAGYARSRNNSLIFLVPGVQELWNRSSFVITSCCIASNIINSDRSHILTETSVPQLSEWGHWLNRKHSVYAPIWTMIPNTSYPFTMTALHSANDPHPSMPHFWKAHPAIVSIQSMTPIHQLLIQWDNWWMGSLDDGVLYFQMFCTICNQLISGEYLIVIAQ